MTVGADEVMCVTVMLLEVAVAEVTQATELVITQVTTPLFAMVEVYVAELEPTLVPFTFH